MRKALVCSTSSPPSFLRLTSSELRSSAFFRSFRVLSAAPDLIESRSFLPCQRRPRIRQQHLSTIHTMSAMTPTLKRKASTLADTAKKPKVNASITSFFGAPKSSATNGAKGSSSAFASEPAAHPKFNKDKWLATLTDEQKSLLKLEIETLDESWLAQLKDDITTKEFLELKRFLDREKAAGKKIFPPREDVYSWSRYTPFHSVKVVILGQDPYHNHNQAHGLAFSVRPPTPAPPSLRNMYTALKRDYPGFVAPPRNGGLLTPWAQRGVLLLNTCLTVRAHEANSHANHGWERFTQRVIDLVAAKRTHGVVFMAWGTPAAKRVARVDQKRHLVLKSVHPSPLSASRGFFDCGHFRKANDWLAVRYGEGSEIDWDLVPKPPKKEEEKKKEVVDGVKGDEKAEPTPVVAVGKVEETKADGGDVEEGGVKEKSEVVEKQGEEGTKVEKK